MTASVVSLASAASNESVIALLRDFLERAERGDLRSAAIASVDAEGAPLTGFSYCPSFAGQIGAVAVLQARLIARAQE